MITKQTEKVVASAPKNCDWCHGALRSRITYYDAAIPGGQWGWFCRSCALMLGVRLGVGAGQEYDSQTNEKIAG